MKTGFLKEGKNYEWKMGAEPLVCTFLRTEHEPNLRFIFDLEGSEQSLSMKSVNDYIEELEIPNKPVGLSDKEMIKKTDWLGIFIKLHSIGDYHFVEDQPKIFESNPVRYENRTQFSVFVNRKAISVSCNSIEEAMAVGMSHKFLGANSQAGSLFCKMIGVYDK